MKRYGLIAAISLLVLVNTLVLAHVIYNRSGAFDAEVTLTERELPIYNSWRPSSKEDTGMSLRLDWQIFDPDTSTKLGRNRSRRIDWFDQAKLESIGFDCSRSITSENAQMHYNKMLSRKTFAVLEYEGKTWQDWKNDKEQRVKDMQEQVKNGKETAKNLENFTKQYKRELIAKSRLFVMDVGNDPFLLRQKYSDRKRYIITPAKVRLAHVYKNIDGMMQLSIDRLEGAIEEILISEINVPLAQQGVLEQLLNEKKNNGVDRVSYQYNSYNRELPPDYAVTLRYGKLYEPWVVDIQRIAAQGTGAAEQ